MASFIVKDKVGRVYPARSKRLAPDFFFQEQIYRADGETIRLPAGEFTITCGRGPEYIPETRAVSIRPSAAPSVRLSAAAMDRSARARVVLGRPSHPCRRVFSLRESDGRGAPGRHDASCAGRSTQRRCGAELGPELLSPAAVLREQGQQGFDGSTLLRYDLEVSGFPSSHCGHLVLLRLREQDYPGHPSDRGLADLGSADPEMGEGAGRGRRLRPLRIRAAGADSRPAELRDAAVQRHRRERIHRGRHPRCRGFHLGRRHAVRLRN